MKENLTVQFLYPDYDIPHEYTDAIDQTYHAKIVTANCENMDLKRKADVVVFKSLCEMQNFAINKNQAYVLKTTMDGLVKKQDDFFPLLPKTNRLSIVFTDILSFTSKEADSYKEFLDKLTEKIIKEFSTNHIIQVNILTDRVLLDSMNNCNAGYESITLAPDGKFYICPAFYLDSSTSVGDIENGLDIKNAQLYRLDHAPICRTCDAFQCRRCVWMNKKSTLEVNTPSQEQCLVAHIERNASKKLLESIQQIAEFMPCLLYKSDAADT